MIVVCVCTCARMFPITQIKYEELLKNPAVTKVMKPKLRQHYEELLEHPIVNRVIKKKLQQYGYFFYFINLVTYILYLAFFSALTQTIPNPSASICNGEFIYFDWNACLVNPLLCSGTNISKVQHSGMCNYCYCWCMLQEQGWGKNYMLRMLSFYSQSLLLSCIQQLICLMLYWHLDHTSSAILHDLQCSK